MSATRSGSPAGRPGRRTRLTLRARLTALYGVTFFTSGAVLLAVVYVLMRESLTRNSPAVDQIAGEIAAPGTTAHMGADQLAALQRQFQDAALDSLLRQSATALLVVGVVAAVLGYAVAGRALRPVHAITATARQVAGGKLSERIVVSGPHDEIAELAVTFNGMLARLDRSFAHQRSFIGHASHELRTPLAVTRAITEVAMAEPGASVDLRRAGASLLEVIARSERLIEGLLQLASSERDVDRRAPVDLVAVCEHVADTLAGEFADRGVRLAQDLGPATTAGSVVLLERLVTNLLQNAARHNVAGGMAVVRTRCAAGSSVLEVSNTGGTVPEAELERLFEPFERLNRDRHGTHGAGLGLSIVRAVSHAHGGTVTAAPMPGGGLVVRVVLPD
ncbi:HAMP domain-containing sensor histidine kinase [Longispora sp. NPDC051575]|uniref:sensor histidine kinase n=1 Tax=Longispora sp. NPDC051575 TaxID=3154943 RepID=UPI0034457C3B